MIMLAPDNAAALVRPDDVRLVAEEVWATFLDPDLPLVPSAVVKIEGWTGAVAIEGDHPGIVQIAVTQSGAERIARNMLGLTADTPVDDDDLTDAIGELANIVGGNVKSMLPSSSRLSLPRVIGPFAPSPVVGIDARLLLGLNWGLEPVHISVSTEPIQPERASL